MDDAREVRLEELSCSMKMAAHRLQRTVNRLCGGLEGVRILTDARQFLPDMRPNLCLTWPQDRPIPDPVYQVLRRLSDKGLAIPFRPVHYPVDVLVNGRDIQLMG